MTISVTEELLAELEEVAKGATPGSWDAIDSPLGDFMVSGPLGEFICGAIGPAQDADFIARANPATVLALIARIRDLEKDAARYRFISSSESRADIEPCVAKCTWTESGEAEFEILCGVRADDYIDAAMQSPPKEGV